MGSRQRRAFDWNDIDRIYQCQRKTVGGRLPTDLDMYMAECVECCCVRAHSPQLYNRIGK